MTSYFIRVPTNFWTDNLYRCLGKYPSVHNTVHWFVDRFCSFQNHIHSHAVSTTAKIRASKGHGISWPAERILVSPDGLCSLTLFLVQSQYHLYQGRNAQFDIKHNRRRALRRTLAKVGHTHQSLTHRGFLNQLQCNYQDVLPKVA